MPPHVTSPESAAAARDASAAAGKPLGLRPSPFTPAMVAELRALAEPRPSLDGRHVYYLEAHDGNGALFAVAASGGAAMRLTSDPPAASVAAYAGGFYAVAREAIVYQGSDRKLYRMPLEGGRGRQLPTGDFAIAGPAFSPDGRWVAYVADDGTTSDIGVIEASGEGWPRKLAVPADFAADAVWSPDGRYLAWVEWSVPNMAWDQSRVVIVDVQTCERRVVMDEPEVSATSPAWSPDGRTFTFMCDLGGYMNLWCAALDGSDPQPLIAEPYDLAPPTWGSGSVTYAWSPDGKRIAYLRNDAARWRLRIFDLAEQRSEPFGDEEGMYSGIRWAPEGDFLVAIFQGPTLAPAVVALDMKGGTQRSLATVAIGGMTGSKLVAPEHITWRGDGEVEARGLLFRPRDVPAGQRPPLLVSVHGGPTGQSSAAFNPAVQYFVGRGWAVFAPNARGSSGYAREYIQLLKGEWGGKDMADIAAGIEQLVARGEVDGERVVVWGGSAGGYAVLLLPILYPQLFKAGVSLFGVSDLFSLARTTHRLEAHYLDRIVGPLPATADRYRERSPVFRAGEYGAPLLMLQGDRDVAVTPDQAHAMADALRAAGKTVILHMYEGEGHGWLHAATNRDYLERMDRFLEEYALLR
jgi:dipeptidyl aminopeptidase/acylaminoacyl peptidase